MGKHALNENREAEPNWPTRDPDAAKNQDAKQKRDTARKVRDALKKL